ncbi:MAG: UDP-galactose-lipid carrier transferase [Acidimicrobiia bacterium]|nr:UDP-galactose-lipid carrier transferase [Acidimicrobiia bacterium]
MARARLPELDLDQKLAKAEYADRLERAQLRLQQLRLHIGGQMGTGDLGPGILIVMEGPDAAGKGGAIKRIVAPLDPRHYRVVTYAKPTYDEKRHHFLWRFYREIPGLGGMVVFDRSWYGRVLVERIEGFASEEQWSRAYDEIVGMERTFVLEGVVLVKFWIHIGDDEQLARFEDRAADPLRMWKITEEDWRNRERNREYDAAAEEMFARTDHELAPWDIVAGDNKRFARVEVLERLNARLEAGMERWGTPVPSPDELA